MIVDIEQQWIGRALWYPFGSGPWQVCVRLQEVRTYNLTYRCRRECFWCRGSGITNFLAQSHLRYFSTLGTYLMVERFSKHPPEEGPERAIRNDIGMHLLSRSRVRDITLPDLATFSEDNGADAWGWETWGVREEVEVEMRSKPRSWG